MAKLGLIKKIFNSGPLFLLYYLSISEIDTNLEKVFEIFTFNLPIILIYFWILKRLLIMGTGHIFLVWLINDVVIGTPMGLSSFCYLMICVVTAYLRNITLSPNFINDWIALLFILLLVNSTQVLFLDLIFSISVNYTKFFVNTGFTFLFYPIFLLIFNKLEKRIRLRKND